MLSGRLYIDGLDAYKMWGVYVVSDGWNELIAFPPLKDVDYNDWHEENGIEVDLAKPRLNVKNTVIKFAFTGLHRRFLDFVSHLANGSYHVFNCAYIDRIYKLRMTEMPNLNMLDQFGFVSIKFSHDYPMQDYEYIPPFSSSNRSDDYLIDERAFTDYGCRILKGTYAEIVKTPAVKPNLLRNISTLNGALYDGERLTVKARNTKLYCLMRARTLKELWRNYDALLYDLTRPNQRSLFVKTLNKRISFYYKNCQVSKFYPSGKIWLEFTLTVSFINDSLIGDKKMPPLMANNKIRLSEAGNIRLIKTIKI